MSQEYIKKLADTKYDVGVDERFLSFVRAGYDVQSSIKYGLPTKDAASRFLPSLQIGEYPAASLTALNSSDQSAVNGAFKMAENDKPSPAESEGPSKAEALWDLLQLIKKAAKEKPKPIT